MNNCRENVGLSCLGVDLVGTLFLPELPEPAPALVVCHGAGEFKENYFGLCELLSTHGIGALALDMHGHGLSKGERHYVNMRQWIADIQAAIDFLEAHPKVDKDRIGAFGLSSGGTAILEAAMIDGRLKTLVTLDATVRRTLPWYNALLMRLLVVIGNVKKRLTKKDLRVSLVGLCNGTPLAADPEIEQRLKADPRLQEAFTSFPFPGAAEAFFVDTLKRVGRVAAPTLVLWGEEDKVDPPETARLLFEALTCRKQLHIIPGNGHVGHLDRNRDKVFALTTDWVLKNLL